MNIPENFDRWMFDFQEGNLSSAEKEAFENFLIQNPQFEVEADAWNNSFIQNEEFVYPQADKLEKDNRIIGGWYAYATAAVLLLLIGTSVVFITADNDKVEGLASNDEVIENEALHNYVVAAPTVDHNLSALNEFNSSNGHLNLLNESENNHDHTNSINNSNDPSLFVHNQNSTSYNPSDQSSVDQSSQGHNLSSNTNPLDNSLANQEELHHDLSTNSSQLTDLTFGEKALDQEYAKYDNENHTTKYQGNPDDGSDLAFDVGKLPSGFSVKGSKWKKFYRKIERMFDYPVGLTNLRDPDQLMPNNSIVSANPGFVGGMLRPRTEINYRNQWFGSNQNSQQMTVSFDNYFYQMRGGVGVIVNAKDYQYGQFGDYNLSLVYSPKVKLSEHVVFEPAVKLTIGALNANGNNLTPESSFELERGRILGTPAAQQMNGNQQLWYKDYGLGFVLNTKWFYAGFSADNLNRHFENVYNEEGFATPTSTPLLLNGVVGFDYLSLNKKMSLSPFVAYQQFGDRQELWAGSSFRLNKFIIGGSMSHKMDFTAMVGMKFDKFKLAYQYDHTHSSLANESFGSHNLTLRFNGKMKRFK